MMEDMFTGDIRVITETWLTNEEAEVGYAVPGLNHYFACRDRKEEHGGVMVYVREGIRCSLLETHKYPEIVALSVGNDRDLLVIAVYASPRQANINVDVFGVISALISQLPAHKCTLILGDLNARVGALYRTSAPFDPHDPLGISEEVPVVVHPRSSEDQNVNPRGRECIRFCNTFSMDIANGCVEGDKSGACTYHSRPNSQRTRGRSAIDLVIVSSECFDWVRELKVTDTRGISDHSMVSVDLQVPGNLNDKKLRRGVGWKRAPWKHEQWTLYAEKVQRCYRRIEAALDGIERHDETESVGQIASQICDQLKGFAKEAFKLPHRNRSRSSGEWWDEECAALMRKVNLGWKRCDALGISHDDALRCDTNALRAMTRRKIREYRVKKDLELATQMKHNPKQFWAKIKKPKSGVGLHCDIEQVVTYFDKLLNVEHSDVSVDDIRMSRVQGNLVGLGPVRLQDDARVVDDVGLNGVITESEVVSVFLRLNNNKSTADDMRSEMFKYAKVREGEAGPWRYLLAGPLAKLFNQLFMKGLGIPDEWRKAHIVAIWKGKGDKSELTNYRGISLVSTLYKVYTMVLEARLSKYCEARNIRAPTQFGFRKHVGTTSAIFALNHVIQSTCTRGLDGKAVPLYLMFVDFRKAFDCVCRNLLMKRLSDLGIKGNMM